jgi:hypothetical protein
MWKVPFALALVCILPGLARAVELKNVRSTYGPLGAHRADNKMLPGDFVYLMYDIEDLQVDPKTFKASYFTVLELVDSQNKVLFRKESPTEVFLGLGGNRVPGDASVITDPKQAPGDYKLKLTVTDRKSKMKKNHEYAFKIIAPTFGIVGTQAAAIGVSGQTVPYIARFALANMTLDAKKKLPNVVIIMSMEDDSGAKVTQPVKQVLPRDLPEGVDLSKENFAVLEFPVFLNRPGRFTMVIDAEDKAGARKASVRIPLTVLDLSKLSGK